MATTYYKVCRVSKGAWISVAAAGKCRRTYSIGKTTYPVPATGLVVFDNQTNAENFRDDLVENQGYAERALVLLAGKGAEGPALPSSRVTGAILHPGKAGGAWIGQGPPGEPWPAGTASAAWFTPTAVISTGAGGGEKSASGGSGR